MNKDQLLKLASLGITLGGTLLSLLGGAVSLMQIDSMLDKKVDQKFNTVNNQQNMNNINNVKGV